MSKQTPFPTTSQTVSIALRRISRGGVGKLGGYYLDRGRPVPCFHPEVFNELIEAGLVTLTARIPDNAGQRPAVLTETGRAWYAALNEPQECR